MKSAGTVLAVVALVAVLSGNVSGGSNPRESSAQLMKQVDAAYLKCKNEMGLKEDSALKYVIAQKELGGGDGCGLACIATNLDLLVDGKIDEAKIMNEVKKVVSKDDLLSKAQTIVHQCVEASSKEEDKCKLVLSFTKCQLTKAQEMKEGKRQ